MRDIIEVKHGYLRYRGAAIASIVLKGNDRRTFRAGTGPRAN